MWRRWKEWRDLKFAFLDLDEALGRRDLSDGDQSSIHGMKVGIFTYIYSYAKDPVVS